MTQRHSTPDAGISIDASDAAQSMRNEAPISDGHVLVIQRGDSKPEAHRNISAEQAIDVVSRLDARLAADLRVANERITAITREIITDPDRTVDYYILEYSRSRTAEVLAQDLEDLTPEEQQKRVDEYHRYSTIGSAILYSDVNFGGKSKFFPTTWPKFSLSPYRFNDKASSAKAWGVNILFEHTWYRGRRFFMVGAPFVQFEDLSAFGFNDTASSILS